MWTQRLAIVGLGALAALACAKEECITGQRLSCANGCGEQRCEGDPPAWSSCSCEQPPEATKPEDAGAPAPLGAPCRRDEECGPHRDCVEPDSSEFLGAAPPQAFCTLRCDQDPSICEELDAQCIVTAAPTADRAATDAGTAPSSDEEDASPGRDVASEEGPAHCLPSCRLGSSPIGKCGGHPHLACASLEGAEDRDRAGVCRPLCSTDEACAEGRCDLSRGLCVQEPATSDQLPLGSACESLSVEPPPPAANSAAACPGLCLDLEGLSYCSQRCVFGQLDNCSDELDTPGLCLYPERPSSRIGDVGYCAQLCNQNDDCHHAQAVCAPFEEKELKALTGHEGACGAAQ